MNTNNTIISKMAYMTLLLVVYLSLCQYFAYGNEIPRVLYTGVFLRGSNKDIEINLPHISKVLFNKKDIGGATLYSSKPEIAGIVRTSLKQNRDKISKSTINGFELVFADEVDDDADLHLAMGILFNNEYCFSNTLGLGKTQTILRITGMVTIIDYFNNNIVANFPFDHTSFFTTGEGESIDDKISSSMKKLLGVTSSINERMHGPIVTGYKLTKALAEKDQSLLNADTSLMGYIERDFLSRLFLPKKLAIAGSNNIKICEVDIKDTILAKLGVAPNSYQRYKTYVGERLGCEISRAYHVSMLPYTTREFGLNKIYNIINDSIPEEYKPEDENGAFQEELPLFIMTYQLRGIKEEILKETDMQRQYGYGVYSRIKVYKLGVDKYTEGSAKDLKANYYQTIYENGSEDDFDIYVFNKIWSNKLNYMTNRTVPKRHDNSFDKISFMKLVLDSSMKSMAGDLGSYPTCSEVFGSCRGDISDVITVD